MSLHAVDDLASAGSMFYRRALEILQHAGVPFLVGGAYALETHTGIVRRTKDFDIFVMRGDIQRALETLKLAGYETELTFPHWIGKAYLGDDFLDIIFSSGNGACRVDQQWFEHATIGTVLGLSLPLCPAEETIWQKAFILERDRCDAADVAHLLKACARRLDWDRLLARFDRHWRVLYVHLVLFGFVYPHHRQQIPKKVMRELGRRLKAELKEPAPEPDVCNGTLLSATQYLRDLRVDALHDGRVRPRGNMTAEEVEIWTANFADQLEQAL